jgi:hypothetical protein
MHAQILSGVDVLEMDNKQPSGDKVDQQECKRQLKKAAVALD